MADQIMTDQTKNEAKVISEKKRETLAKARAAKARLKREREQEQQAQKTELEQLRMQVNNKNNQPQQMQIDQNNGSDSDSADDDDEDMVAIQEPTKRSRQPRRFNSGEFDDHSIHHRLEDVIEEPEPPRSFFPPQPLVIPYPVYQPQPQTTNQPTPNNNNNKSTSTTVAKEGSFWSSTKNLISNGFNYVKDHAGESIVKALVSTVPIVVIGSVASLLKPAPQKPATFTAPQPFPDRIYM
jgi:hypothetical protein